MRVYQRLASFILAFFFLVCFTCEVYAREDQGTQPQQGQDQPENSLWNEYIKAQEKIRASNLPQELKERMFKHNDDLYRLAQGMGHFDSVLFVTPTNANQKPINVEMSLKYDTFVYGEPSGPHPSMIGKTNEPWLLALTYMSANFNF